MLHIACQYFLNSDLRKKELEEQTDLLCDAGFEEIYLHARAGMKTPYLSKSWFDALNTVADTLKARGVKFSIWDEDNYPSGCAGSRIANNYPELNSAKLNALIFEGKKGVAVQEYFSDRSAFAGCFAVNDSGDITDISEYCGTLRRNWDSSRYVTGAYSPNGHYLWPHRRRSMDTPRLAVEYTPEEDCTIIAVEIIREYGRHNTDLLNRETTDILVQLTHEAYKEKMGAERMKSCCSSFLDEPAPDGRFPWTRKFPEEFKADHRYDIMPLLPHLFCDISTESAKIRMDYRLTLHRLICNNYLENLRQYLNKNSIQSVGHLCRSEWLSYSNRTWPDELRCYKYLDIPCGDPLGRGIGRIGDCAHHLGLKAVSSAASLFGKAAAGADAFAVGGDSVSLQELKFMADYHLVLGINYFNIHGLAYSLEGERRDETPPSLFYQHSQWKHMKEFLRYLKERCLQLTGTHECSTGMLYPSAMYMSLLTERDDLDTALHNFAEELVSHQKDFELIDEITLAEQDIAEYIKRRPYFIIAHTTLITKSTAEYLEKYAAAGGKLLIYGGIPHLIDVNGAPVWSFAAAYLTVDVEKLPGFDLAGTGREAVMIRRVRKQDGSTVTMLFNRADLPFKGTFEGKDVELAPGSSCIAEELRNSAAVPVEMPEKWRLKFVSPNSVPLTFWEYPGGYTELLSTAKFETLPLAEATKFTSRFFASDGFEIKLVIEEQMLKNGSFSVNGTPVSDFVPAQFRDCRELECDITHLLKTGRSPLFNQIIYTGNPLFENPPYLRGNFSAKITRGNESYPILTAARPVYDFTEKFDFSEGGYASYSGSAICRSSTTVENSGRYIFVFGSISDSAQLFIDGKECGIRIAPPWNWEVELEAGEHEIAVEICNAPGNRDRMLGLPAGIKIKK